MKTLLSFLTLAATLAAADQPAACCAPEEKKPAACCCANEKPAAKQDACCAEEKPAAACCQEEPAAKKDACCAGEEPAKKDACCEELENPKSKTQNLSSTSLYQADATFTDDQGRAFSLGELRGRPVVLTMFFASCGYACPLLVNDMRAIRAQLPAEIRDRAALVLVSFDTARDTPAALAKYRTDRALDGQWTLLHGDDGAVRELAALLGVKYKQEADGMFAHSNLITVLNAQGEVVHQRTGLKGGLEETAAAVARVSR